MNYFWISHFIIGFVSGVYIVLKICEDNWGYKEILVEDLFPIFGFTLFGYLSLVIIVFGFLLKRVSISSDTVIWNNKKEED